MASRVSEVLYSLRDFFTAPSKKIRAGYADLRKASRKTAEQIEKDSARKESAFSRLTKTIGTLATRLGLFGAAASAAFGAVLSKVNTFATEIDRVAKVGKKLGVTTEELSALSYAAERSGVSAQQFEVAMQRLIRKTGDAVNGLGEAKKAFAALGIDAEAFAQLNLEDKLARLSAAFNALGGDAEGLSALQKIVDSEGLGLSVLLQEGPDGIKRLTAEFRELGRVIDQETAAAAEKYADQISRLGAQIDKIKYDALTTPLEFVNDLLEDVGGGERLDGLIEELRELEDEIENARAFGSLYFNFTKAEAAAQKLRDQIEDITLVRERAAEAARKETDAARQAQVEYQANERALKSLSATQKDRIKGLQETLRQETDELRKAKREQLDIEQEFDKLRKDVVQGDDEDVTLSAVSRTQRQAAAALEAGNLDQAIELARDGGDLLGKLKDKGTEIPAILGYMADQLGLVAKEASAAQVEKELLDAQKIQDQVTLAEGHFKHLTTVLKEEGGKAGTAFVEEMTRVMQQTTIPAPVVERPSVPLPDVVQQGINSYTSELEKRGSK